MSTQPSGLIEPRRSRAADECLFCRSRRCYVRIHTANGLYDEIACRDHARDLERHSDRHLGRAIRTSTSSSSPQRREHGRRWVVFLIDAQAVGRPIKLAGRTKETTEVLHEAITFESERDARCWVVNDMVPHLRIYYRPIVGRMD